MTKAVAFQGEVGAYSEQALAAYFGPESPRTGVRRFRDVFDRVSVGEARAGIVPVENSVAGSVSEAIDLLMDMPPEVRVVGETYLKVSHCLLGTGEATLQAVKVAISHPQALGQCARFLEEQGIEARPSYDTAGAAQEVAERADPSVAAIASEWAGQRYGLKVLRADLQSFRHNTTRFLVIARESAEGGTPDWKTTVWFETRDLPGALYKSLGGFATNGVNLTKLESRPARTGIGRYRFYLECEGHRDEPALDNALRELGFFAVRWHVLGSYPRAEVPG